MADANWYESLAKSGWLGTKAQVAADKGNPSWKTSTPEPPQKTTQSGDSGSSDQMDAMKRRLSGG